MRGHGALMWMCAAMIGVALVVVLATGNGLYVLPAVACAVMMGARSCASCSVIGAPRKKLHPNCTPTPRGPSPPERQKPRITRAFAGSGRQDLNLRPPGPQPERSRPVSARSAL